MMSGRSQHSTRAIRVALAPRGLPWASAVALGGQSTPPAPSGEWPLITGGNAGDPVFSPRSDHRLELHQPPGRLGVARRSGRGDSISAARSTLVACPFTWTGC